jgi:hypothetical protein
VLAVAPVQGLAQPKVVIIGEDGGRGSLAPGSRAFGRVIDVLVAELRRHGVEAAVSFGPAGSPPQTRLTEPQIALLARGLDGQAAQGAMTIAVLASSRRTAQYAKVQTRLVGRLLRLPALELIDTFDVRSVFDTRVAQPCGHDCLLDAAATDASILARDIGGRLAARLNVEPARPIATDWIDATFDGFLPAEWEAIEPYVRALPGYVWHQRGSATDAAFVVRILLAGKSADVARDLRTTLDLLDLTGDVETPADRKIHLRRRLSAAR